MALENEYLVKGESIKGVADAIRAKTSTAGELSFPEGFKTAISGIKTEKPEQEKTTSASPDAAVIVSPDVGKVLSKVTVGKIPRATGNGIIDYPDPTDPHKAIFKINLTSPGYLDSENVDSMGMGLYAYLEEKIIPGTTDTVLESGRYIDGNITIKGDANLTSGNIKSGSSIFGVNGTFTSDATATSGKILKDETAYVKGQKVTGTIPSQQGSTVIPGTTAKTAVAAGTYAAGDVKVAGDTNLVSRNIKSGSTIFGVAGNRYVVDTEDTGVVSSDDIMDGISVYAHGAKITGTMPLATGTIEVTVDANDIEKAYMRPNVEAAGFMTDLAEDNFETVINAFPGKPVVPSTSDVVIPNGTYIYDIGEAGLTIKGDANLVSGNIKSGVSIFGVSGNKNVVDTTLADTVKAQPLQIKAGRKCYVNGELVTGTMQMVAPTASASLNTATGKVTPTAAIGDGYALSGQYTGTVLQLPTVQGLLVNPGTTSQVIIPAGKYTLSDTIVQGDANLVAGNIKKGVSIFGVSGTYIGDTTKATFEVNEDQSSYPYKIEIVASTGGRVESGDIVGEIPQADLYYANNGATGCDILADTTGACFGGDASLTIPYYVGSVVFQDIQDNIDSFNISVYADGSVDGYIPPDGSYVIGSSDILKSDLASLESDCKPENIKKGATILGVAGTYEGESTDSAGNTWYQHTVKFTASYYSNGGTENHNVIYDGSVVFTSKSSDAITSWKKLSIALHSVATSQATGTPCGGYMENATGNSGWLVKMWSNSNLSTGFYYKVYGQSTYSTFSIPYESSNFTTVTDTVKTLGVVSPSIYRTTDATTGLVTLTIWDNL